MARENIADILLRIGVALSFLYPPIDALANPYSWLGYFPHFLQGILPDMVILHSFGVVEVVLALWILSGKHIFWPSTVATLMLLAIVLFNGGDFPILFRDVSIACMSAALAFMHTPLFHKESL